MTQKKLTDRPDDRAFEYGNERTLLSRTALAEFYRERLSTDVLPFWLRHGIDREHGGFITSLNRDGSVLDTDKSIWFQGRGAWMFATMYNDVQAHPEWLQAATSGIEFLRRYAESPDGKLYFTVTREGRPLRMRRYYFSEAFAAIAEAAFARATGDPLAERRAVALFDGYLHPLLSDDKSVPKVNPATRPAIGLAPWMICIVTAQELRSNLGDVVIRNRHCTEWIDVAIEKIERCFMKPDEQALMEIVAPDGQILNHFDGRQLNPGHALECAWFIMHEGRHRQDQRLIHIGLTILDWMWKRGWDEEYGGIHYFRDVYDLPVQEYWHDMKFWWPHCEAIIAALLAWELTGDVRYRHWHDQVHRWSFDHFPDPQYGEWYGYLHRDGRISVPLKGNLWKGPFHLPRMLWYCWRLSS